MLQSRRTKWRLQRQAAGRPALRRARRRESHSLWQPWRTRGFALDSDCAGTGLDASPCARPGSGSKAQGLYEHAPVPAACARPGSGSKAQGARGCLRRVAPCARPGSGSKAQERNPTAESARPCARPGSGSRAQGGCAPGFGAISSATWGGPYDLPADLKHLARLNGNGGGEGDVG